MCNRNMGVANASSTTPNNFLGAGNADLFRIQREWSNAAGGGGCAASYTTTGSFVESPTPSGGDVTNTVTESSIAGNNGDLLHYHLSFHDPSNQDDAFSVSVADTLPSGISGSPPSALGDLAPHQTANEQLHRDADGRAAPRRHHPDRIGRLLVRRLDRSGTADDHADRDHHGRERGADGRRSGTAVPGLPRRAQLRRLGNRSRRRRLDLARGERAPGGPDVHGQRQPHRHRLRDDHGDAGRLHGDVHRRRPPSPEPLERHGADHGHPGGDDHDLHRADGRRAGLPGDAHGPAARGRHDRAVAERADPDALDRRAELCRHGGRARQRAVHRRHRDGTARDLDPAQRDVRRRHVLPRVVGHVEDGRRLRVPVAWRLRPRRPRPWRAQGRSRR